MCNIPQLVRLKAVERMRICTHGRQTYCYLAYAGTLCANLRTDG